MEEEGSLLGHTATPRQQKPSSLLQRYRNSVTFLILGFFLGFLVYFALFSSILSRDSVHNASKEVVLGEKVQEQLYHTVYHTVQVTVTATATATATATETYLAPLPTNVQEKPPGLNEEGLLELSLDELRARIATTEGYLAREWSLRLGWNNMRYIIEAGVLQADLLNRTLILPSFVYARACEYHNDVCAKYATMINRNDALKTDEWRELPLEQQMGWKIPIEVMIDIPHLRKKHNVVTLLEYLTLQGLDPERETSDGKWDDNYYRSGPQQPSLFVIQNFDYDPPEIVRVDYWDHKTYEKKQFPWIPRDWSERIDEELVRISTEKEKSVLGWDVATEAVNHVISTTNETQIEQALESAGWIILHTFEGEIGLDFTKTVINPTKQIARYDKVRGLGYEYDDVIQDILIIVGEIHLNRKAGFMRFTTEEGRDRFARIVLQDIRVSERVVNLAEKVISRMDGKNDGRSWTAAHMRRGDFATKGWAMAPNLEDHFDRIMGQLAYGRTILEQLIHAIQEPYHVPDVVLNYELTNRPPPLEGDFIYLATDERSPDGLRYLREHKSILFDDLVTQEDRREFGWPLLFTDVAALVEQQIIGRGAGYFYAHALSSVAGGILNIRAASGCDKRTAYLD